MGTDLVTADKNSLRVLYFYCLALVKLYVLRYSYFSKRDKKLSNSCNCANNPPINECYHCVGV